MELWDLYDENRVKLHRTMVRGAAQPEGTFRLVVHVCVFNSGGELLIQQRQPFKAGWSNLWDVSAGGSAIAGETSAQAARRELFEELGLLLPSEQFQTALTVNFEGGFDDFYLIECDVNPSEQFQTALTVNFEGGFDDFYLIECDVNPSELRLQPEEVQAVCWADRERVLQMLADGSFLPLSPHFVELLFFMRRGMGILTASDTTHATEK